MKKEVRLLFCKSNNIGGWLIRAALMSKYNHVGIQIGEKVYDSTFAHGVDVWDQSKFYKTWRIGLQRNFDLSESKVEKLEEFLNSQLGKSYDWHSLVGLPFRQDWNRDRKWMCSELAAAAFSAIGYYFPISYSRITPRDLLFFTQDGDKI